MSHLHTAHALGAQAAREAFEKEAFKLQTAKGLLQSALLPAAVGSGVGAMTGALGSDEGQRGAGALRGAGLGALLGGAGGLGGKALWGPGVSRRMGALDRAIKGPTMAAGSLAGGVAGGVLGGKEDPTKKRLRETLNL